MILSIQYTRCYFGLLSECHESTLLCDILFVLVRRILFHTFFDVSLILFELFKID